MIRTLTLLALLALMSGCARHRWVINHDGQTYVTDPACSLTTGRCSTTFYQDGRKYTLYGTMTITKQE